MIYRIGVLASGGGSNFQAILDNIKNNKLRNCEISLLISNNDKAFALERAKREGIKTLITKDEKEMILALKKESIDIIVLAGYMRVLGEDFIDTFKDSIVNIHPSLIPKYCGKGFYGMKVHEAVVKAGERESGATCHLVDIGVDTGEILVQKKIEIFNTDTPKEVAKKVLKIEHEIFSQGICELIRRKEKK